MAIDYTELELVNQEEQALQEIYDRYDSDEEQEKYIEEDTNHAQTIIMGIVAGFISYHTINTNKTRKAIRRENLASINELADEIKALKDNKTFVPDDIVNKQYKALNNKMDKEQISLAKIDLELTKMYEKHNETIFNTLFTAGMQEANNVWGKQSWELTEWQDKVINTINSEWHDKTIEDRIWRLGGYYQTHKDNMNDNLYEIKKSIKGLTTDRTYETQVDRLQKVFNENTNELADTFRATKDNVIMLLQTEESRVITITRHEQYKINEFTHYKFIAEHDDITCEVCQGLDGQIFPIEEMAIGSNVKPMHPRCRCNDIGLILN